MIFSLIKVRKKTSTVIAGVMIGVACLWGIAMWQDVSARQLFNVLLGSLALILGIMLTALLVIVTLKGVGKLIRKSLPGDESDEDPS